jgi:hypothetical protein
MAVPMRDVSFMFWSDRATVNRHWTDLLHQSDCSIVALPDSIEAIPVIKFTLALASMLASA